jgi:predicted thioredoxin/glutaredoxin
MATMEQYDELIKLAIRARNVMKKKAMIKDGKVKVNDPLTGDITELIVSGATQTKITNDLDEVETDIQDLVKDMYA